MFAASGFGEFLFVLIVVATTQVAFDSAPKLLFGCALYLLLILSISFFLLHHFNFTHDDLLNQGTFTALAFSGVMGSVVGIFIAAWFVERFRNGRPPGDRVLFSSTSFLASLL